MPCPCSFSASRSLATICSVEYRLPGIRPPITGHNTRGTLTRNGPKIGGPDTPTTGVALGSAWRGGCGDRFEPTFSAPKSVSTLWALGDTRTMAADRRRARCSGDHGARLPGKARVVVAARPRRCAGRSATPSQPAALFDHRTSRSWGPAAAHPRPGDRRRWRVAGRGGRDGHEIYHHKKAAGVVYQAALRAELTGRLPVVFGAVSEHGQAEIQGVPRGPDHGGVPGRRR